MINVYYVHAISDVLYFKNNYNNDCNKTIIFIISNDWMNLTHFCTLLTSVYHCYHRGSWPHKLSVQWRIRLASVRLPNPRPHERYAYSSPNVPLNQLLFFHDTWLLENLFLNARNKTEEWELKTVLSLIFYTELLYILIRYLIHRMTYALGSRVLNKIAGMFSWDSIQRKLKRVPIHIFTMGMNYRHERIFFLVYFPLFSEILTLCHYNIAKMSVIRLKRLVTILH